MVDTLIDSGPLIAVVNRNDNHHAACAQIIRNLDCPFYTTLPVLTEAMYVAGERMGRVAQAALWKIVLRGDLILEHPSMSDLQRMAELMDKYGDRPMDFADASLVALAERLSLERIFTLDRTDFSIYRIGDKKPFVILSP